MAFVTLSNVTLCALPTESERTANDFCDLVKNTTSCGLFVTFIDFMDIFFCGFKLPFMPLFGSLIAIALLGLLSLLHMITTFFFIPNLVTLIEFAPMTNFGFTYLFFGPSVLIPYYMSTWPSCGRHIENLSPLQFAKLVGDIMRYFLIGSMVLSVRGYKADGDVFWSCIGFILVGMIYMRYAGNRKYDIHEMDVLSSDLFKLELRATLLIFSLIMVLIVVLLVSFTAYARSNPKEEKIPQMFSDMESDDEVLGSYPKQRIFSRAQIWSKTVNPIFIMKECHLLYRIIMAPAFFIIAHIIPVISMDRIHLGWVKCITCLSFIALPFLCLFFKINLANFLSVLIVCCLFSLLVFISTHSMRRPDYVWTFSLLGVVVSSLIMRVLSREIENLTWQYMSLQYDMQPDLNALLYFGLGEIFIEALVVKGLQQRSMWHASFGAVMSITTYSTFMAFPLLFHHECYIPNCKFICTASTETAIQYAMLMMSTSSLHIGMSGYEYRMSLFVYLLVLTFIYWTFQWMNYYGSLFPIAFLQNIE